MEWHRILKIARNIFGHTIIHPLVLFCTLWISGAIIAIFTREFDKIGLDVNALNICYKWTDWLIKAWSQLSFESYNYLKLKLLLSLLGPLLFMAVVYYRNFKRIISKNL